MSTFNYKQRNNIVLVILIILGCAILYSLRTIAGTLLSTVVMYTIFRPAFLFLTERWQWKRIAAAVTIILGSFLIIILPIMLLGMMVIDKVAEFQKDAIRIHVLIDKVNDFVSSKFNQPNIVENILKRGNALLSDLFPSIIGGAADIVVGVAIMYFLLYFMFTQHEEFEGGLLKYAPFREQNALKFALELKNTTFSNILGQGFIAFVQGALLSIGFFIFGIQDAVFWGVIATFISFIPILGAPVIFIPAAAIQLVNGNEFGGVGLLLWGFILVINIDNVIRYIIAKRVADTHPIISIIGVIIGVPMFGIMGLVFGPLLISYFILTIKIYETSKMASERLEKIKSAEEKHLSENTL